MTSNKRTYKFQKEWQDKYFFINLKEKCVCLICHSTVARFKKCNVERHFFTNHKGYNDKYLANSAIKQAKIEQLKSNLVGKQRVLTQFISKSSASTAASFVVAKVLAKRKTPFDHGETVKECMIEASTILFENFINKAEIMSAVKSMPLSRNTVTHRIETMSQNVKSQIILDLKKCIFFSLQFDESTDIVDISQLIVFVRMIFSDNIIKEEFLALIPLKQKTRGVDIYTAFKNFACENDVPLQKLASITTDGAPAMVGKNIGFIGLCKKDEDFPSFISYHCIIHQQVLCTKVIQYEHIMSVIVKVINSIRARPLQHRLFKALLEEVDSEHGDLILHTQVRWLSRGKVIDRFENLLSEIKNFLYQRGEVYEKLSDPEWLSDLSFLNDITTQLNKLNLELQGAMKTISQMMSSINSFTNKLKLWKSQLTNKNFSHFPNLNARIQLETSFTVDANRYAHDLQKITDSFQDRFSDFTLVLGPSTFISNPFMNYDVENTATQIEHLFKLDKTQLEMEIITLQSDVPLQSHASDPQLWKLIDAERFPLLKETYQKLLSCFGSTYISETGFSTMKILKYKNRSRLTDSHLSDCMRMALTKYEPDIQNLAKEMQSQGSH